MDSPAAIPAAQLRHSKHLQLNSRRSQLSSTPVSLSSCRAAGLGHVSRLDTRVRGWAVACLTTLYNIGISRCTGLRYRDTIFSHDTSPITFACVHKSTLLSEWYFFFSWYYVNQDELIIFNCWLLHFKATNMISVVIALTMIFLIVKQYFSVFSILTPLLRLLLEMYRSSV